MAALVRELTAVIGVGTFELVAGLLVATLLVYFAFRGRASPAILVLLILVLTPIIAMIVAYGRYALFGG